MDISKGLPVGVNEVPRRSANYHPSTWGDYFLLHASADSMKDDSEELEKVEALKEEVRKMLMEVDDTSSEKLELIDTIQRLGVSYHFEEEIDTSLQLIYKAYTNELINKYGDDLYLVALAFRLLRQHGHFVSCDVFKKFMNCEGKLEEPLSSNVPTMLSLYEASHLRIRGEDILEEALVFTTNNLKSMIPSLSNSTLKEQVIHALKHPIHMSLTRVEARGFISMYQNDDTRNEVLLEFAKLDFNLLQKMHKKELSYITKWWKDLDIVNNCSFARDRLVECYLWTLGVYFEKEYEIARRMLAKVLALATIIDDIYDVYGNYDELRCFTNAIERWDASGIDKLPPCMSYCYHALFDVYSEMEEELAKTGKSYRVHHAKHEMKRMIGAYLEERKWFYSSYVPTIDEYMKVAFVTSGCVMIVATSLVGIEGDLINKNVMDWVTSNPLIVQASDVIARLMNDMAGHEFEQERGHTASAVECYMKQHGTSKQETLLELQKLVSNAWKDINQQCLYPTEVPMLVLKRVVNLARVLHLLYEDGDAYTHSATKLKDLITSVIVNPIP